MKLNQKGYTLIEILAAITILGIITYLAVAGYTRYLDYARQKSYKVLFKSAATAAEEFIMDNPGASVATKEVTEADGSITYAIESATAPGVSFQTLVEEGYLKEVMDPGDKNIKCKGKVTIGLVRGETKGALDQYIYVVDSCCPSRKTRYTYTITKVKVVKDGEETFEYHTKEIDDRNGAVCS